MTTFSANAVQHSINQLIINTINDVEKLLLNLPRDGDRVEVITSSSHEQSVNPSDSLPCKTTHDVVVDEVTASSWRKSWKVQVSPLRLMDGVMIDLVVMIKMKSGGTRTVNMQIECPAYQPKRVRVDGIWHNIV
ncbi:hypothetical protein KIN20_035600 [Parelaphostrongylus tenuis]|uniref:Uncharacterized protein n=1 Tax=Parelaphostrongylus tenuis TaxID=148309 RepID=A0AAD5RBF0_PARTN|nr:hypothetical protein KIN20_035600 [Parelaphostrongylus tenuis]